jgi:hypothetical protein
MDQYPRPIRLILHWGYGLPTLDDNMHYIETTLTTLATQAALHLSGKNSCNWLDLISHHLLNDNSNQD